MGHLIHSYSYVYCRNNKVLGVSLAASYKGNSTTLLFLQLHTLGSDQLIIRCSQTKIHPFRFNWRQKASQYSHRSIKSGTISQVMTTSEYVYDYILVLMCGLIADNYTVKIEWSF